ncbi:hypothetical protein N665_0012s0164 [Sinapis alba]|nr:hypothetical protein N665_0012s0164 [Sinapis alba]
MASKITFFLLLALVIACATVSVPTAEAKCTTVNDCPILLCNVGETQCVHNQCKCARSHQIHGQPCRTTEDCDPTTICKSLRYKCVDGSCTCA